jgi:hypothetical protein
MHGPPTDKEKSLVWLCRSGLRGETEILIIAAQDQALNKYVLSSEEHHVCYKAEHIEHIVVGCTTLSPSEYTKRHNKMAGYIHWMLCKHRGYRLLTGTVNIYLKGS